MPRFRLSASLVALAAGACIAAAPATPAAARSHRHRAPYLAGSYPAVVRGIPVYGNAVLPPLAGTRGRAIPPEAARFMGYPYNVPGYRYSGEDACFLRVGGLFGPGPSAGPCPFGLDRAF